MACLIHLLNFPKITIDVRLQTLVSTAPHDFAHLLAGHDPLPESLHLRHENFGMLSTREIHECITKTSIGVEIDGEINHVVLAWLARFHTTSDSFRVRAQICVLILQIDDQLNRACRANPEASCANNCLGCFAP